MIKQFEITLPPLGRGFHLITDYILREVGKLPEVGLMNIFIKHTSAAITINENADPSVRYDLETTFSRLVPDDVALYTHTLEGADDMPAHVKSSMIGASITIPITNHKLNLGTWQGIYLCEFRNHARGRKLVITIFS